MGKVGKKRGVREAHSDLHVPTEFSRTKTREQRHHRRVRGNRTEVDIKVADALKHGIQRDKKRANFEKFKDAKKDAKKERRAVRRDQRRSAGAAKLVPKTKENLRRPVLGMVEDANDKEIRRDEQIDEFSQFYAQTREKIPEVDEEKEEDDDELWEDVPMDEDLEQNDEEFIENKLNKERQQELQQDDDDDLVADEEANDDEEHDDDDDDDGHDHDADDLGLNEEDAEKPAEKKKIKNPTVLITTCKRPHYRTRLFVREALMLFPNSTFRPRRNYTLTEIIDYCTQYGFKFVICIGERIKQPFEMIVTHLPDGPTATFRVSNFLSHKELEEPAERTKHYPELNLKNFDTRLGRRVSRMLEAMFPASRDFAGRAIATFHNQRDFIFVRTHRYIFDGMEAVRIQELGPRFTLRLMSLQKGTFDSKFGEYEWIRKKVHDDDKLEWYL